MPLKQPPRDLSKVKCVKKSKDKNGEEVIEYQVLFDFVSNHTEGEVIKELLSYVLGSSRVGLDRGDGDRPEGDLHHV